jgi:hypothetical protein
MKIAIAKYNPNDFNHVFGLSGELTMFYNLHNEYINDKTQRNCFALEKHGKELFSPLNTTNLKAR